MNVAGAASRAVRRNTQSCCDSPVHLLRSLQKKNIYIHMYIDIVIPQIALELNAVLNSSKKQALFHQYFLVPARVPGLVSLLFLHPVASSFPGSG